MKSKIIDKRRLILLLFLLLAGFSFGCGKEIGVETNRPPVICYFEPESLELIINEGDSLGFSVVAIDPGGEKLSYYWSLNGEGVSTAAKYLFCPGMGNYGTKEVTVNISDGELKVTKTWSITVNGLPRVSILSPQDGNRYDPKATIGFAGEAVDFEDGPLSGASLVLVLFNKKEGV